MPTQIQHEATIATFGGLATDRRTYQPLDTVTVHVTAHAPQQKRCTIRVCDPEQQPYFEQQLTLEDGRAQVQFRAGGRAGSHYVYLTWEGQQRYSRYLNFRLACETRIASGDADFDELYPFTREALQLGRREYDMPAGKFVGYVSADTNHFDGIWLRDWIYGLPAYRYWERDMLCGLTRFLECQTDNGMIPDGIERDGRTWRVGLESDVEYILVMGAWQSWQATGDDVWLAEMLPKLERSLAYITSDSKHWDESHQLIKRQHSCDTWDFDIDGASDKGDSRHVIATCDQTGYILAFEAMSRMHAHLDHTEQAQRWAQRANDYRERANKLLWDGGKYLHHVHLDPNIEHGDFDESQQLAMSNTWAITRGMASAPQARAIVDEYRRRHEETGDAYPWWSLQPGYPDKLGYFKNAYCKQGGYANGGLMPWVGGELCRGAFQCGREKYGVTLLRQYADHLRRTGGAHVWYWTNGETGFRTRNEVPYAGWGMAEWMQAAVSGLAGIVDESCKMNAVRVTPRWAAANIDDVTVAVSYAASGAYFAYRMKTDAQKKQVEITCTGSGESAQICVLLPEGWKAKSVSVDGEAVELETDAQDQSHYAGANVSMHGVQRVVVTCE